MRVSAGIVAVDGQRSCKCLVDLNSLLISEFPFCNEFGGVLIGRGENAEGKGDVSEKTQKSKEWNGGPGWDIGPASLLEGLFLERSGGQRGNRE